MPDELLERGGVHRFVFKEFAGNAVELVAVLLKDLLGLPIGVIENSLDFFIHLSRGLLAAITLEYSIPWPGQKHLLRSARWARPTSLLMP